LVGASHHPQSFRFPIATSFAIMDLQAEITATKRKLEQLERAAHEEAMLTRIDYYALASVDIMCRVWPVSKEDREFLQRFVRTNVASLVLTQTRQISPRTYTKPDELLHNDTVVTRIEVTIRVPSPPSVKECFTTWLYALTLDVTTTSDPLHIPQATVVRMPMITVRAPEGWSLFDHGPLSCSFQWRTPDDMFSTPGQARLERLESAMQQAVKKLNDDIGEHECVELDADARRFMAIVMSLCPQFLAGGCMLALLHYVRPIWKKRILSLDYAPRCPSSARDPDEHTELEADMEDLKKHPKMCTKIVIV
jgi:hypothetical protein